MARAKNRGYQQKLSPSYTIRRWRLGEYIRLSKEDLKKSKDYKDDSNSVKNQRDLLNDFYQMHIDEFESVSEYVDDGHTGTDAERENFQRLLSDVMSGKINCVIVKDLSRFARNYSDAGSLIDNLFVQLGVRFISLAENVDSYLSHQVDAWRRQLLLDESLSAEQKLLARYAALTRNLLPDDNISRTFPTDTFS